MKPGGGRSQAIKTLVILLLLVSGCGCSTACNARSVLCEKDLPTVTQSTSRAVSNKPWVRHFIDDYVRHHIGGRR